MPRWETTALDDGQVRHELTGRSAGVRVEVMPAERMVLLVGVYAVEGTDDATVERCKRRAERLLVEIQRGEVR